jgi:hypothetical protein
MTTMCCHHHALAVGRLVLHARDRTIRLVETSHRDALLDADVRQCAHLVPQHPLDQDP